MPQPPRLPSLFESLIPMDPEEPSSPLTPIAGSPHAQSSSPVPGSPATPTPQVSRRPQIGRQPSPMPASVHLNSDMYSSEHVWESPHVRGRTKQQRVQSRKENRMEKKKKQAQEKEQEADAARQAALAQTGTQRAAAIAEVLALMHERGLTWGDLVLHMSDPASGLAAERFDGFFSKPEDVQKVLNLWASSRNSRTGSSTVREWAVHWVAKSIQSEAAHATKSGLLQSRRMTVDEDFVYKFDLAELHGELKTLCPKASYLLEEFSMTARQRRKLTDAQKTRNTERVGAALVDLLGEHSQNNSYMKHILGLYLYASGAARQLLSVLSHLGVCSSYQTLAGTVAEPNGRSSQTYAGTDDSEASETDSDSDWEASSTDGTRTSKDSDSAVESAQVSCAEDSDAYNLLSSEDPGQRRVSAGSRNVDDIGQGADAPVALNTVAPAEWRGMGLLRRLSNACRLRSRQRAQDSMLGYVYDNINMMFKVAEQTLGRRDTQQNGTCATVFPLYSATPSDMRTMDLVQSYDDAPPLKVEDIVLSPAEDKVLHSRLQHAVLRIIVLHGGAHFTQRFRSDLMYSMPETEDKIPLHQTEIRPLPAMHIDESTTTGNAEVMAAIFKELGFDMQADNFADTVKLVFGDQLSIARLRTLMLNRSGHDTVANAYPYVACGPGFFHHQMAMTHGFIETHWGDSTAGASNPGSLSFHNTTLERKPIVLSSLPPYRTCRDLIFVSLDARVMHCLELVSSCANIDEYAQNVTWEELVEHADEIVQLYADPQRVWALRRAREVEKIERLRDAAHAVPSDASERKNDTTSQPGTTASFTAEPSPPTRGDMVFENAVLFMRDALVLRELADAIKAGDSGRIVLILKVMALSYRGSGRGKYAHEMLFLIHSLTHIWPKPLRDIILKNWLVNPTGRTNSWVPVDLLQEHMNFWIKTIYKAQGSNASWRWIEMVAPCVDILRKLAAQINGSLGSRQGTKHHTPELEKDIRTLKISLDDFDVYRVRPGRIIENDKAVVPNVVATGFTSLPGPLEDYNRTFLKLKQRRRNQPVLGEPIIQAPATCQDSCASPQPGASLTNPIENLQTAPEDDNNYEEEDGEDDEFEQDDLETPLLFSLEDEGDVDLDMDAL